MTIPNNEVKALAERIASIDAQIEEFQSDRKDVLAEAKSKGYDAALIGKVAKLIRADAEKRRKTIDQHDLFGSYIDAAGVR